MIRPMGSVIKSLSKEGHKTGEALRRTSSRLLKLTPTRSCQAYSKQFCLWDLALIIYIVSIIQMVWAS